MPSKVFLRWYSMHCNCSSRLRSISISLLFASFFHGSQQFQHIPNRVVLIHSLNLARQMRARQNCPITEPFLRSSLLSDGRDLCQILSDFPHRIDRANSILLRPLTNHPLQPQMGTLSSQASLCPCNALCSSLSCFAIYPWYAR